MDLFFSFLEGKKVLINSKYDSSLSFHEDSVDFENEDYGREIYKVHINIDEFKKFKEIVDFKYNKVNDEQSKKYHSQIEDDKSLGDTLEINEEILNKLDILIENFINGKTKIPVGYFTVAQLAKHLGQSKDAIRKWAETGYLPSYKFGTSVRFDIKEIGVWVKKRKVRHKKSYDDD